MTVFNLVRSSRLGCYFGCLSAVSKVRSFDRLIRSDDIMAVGQSVGTYYEPLRRQYKTIQLKEYWIKDQSAVLLTCGLSLD